MLGSYFLEELPGGCTVPPKAPFARHGAHPILGWCHGRGWILRASRALFVLDISGLGH